MTEDRLRAIESCLARIEEKLKNMTETSAEYRGSAKERMDRFEESIIRIGERIGKVEADLERLRGGKTALLWLISCGGVIGAALLKLFSL